MVVKKYTYNADSRGYDIDRATVSVHIPGVALKRVARITD